MTDQALGRVALVTGGSRGIGRAIAAALGKRGVKVAINWVANEFAAQQTLEQVRASGGDGATCRHHGSRRLRASRPGDFPAGDAGQCGGYLPARDGGQGRYDRSGPRQHRLHLVDRRVALKAADNCLQYLEGRSDRIRAQLRRCIWSQCSGQWHRAGSHPDRHDREYGPGCSSRNGARSLRQATGCSIRYFRCCVVSVVGWCRIYQWPDICSGWGKSDAPLKIIRA